MPKRKRQEKIEYYRNKLRKYENLEEQIGDVAETQQELVGQGYSPTGYSQFHDLSGEEESYTVEHVAQIEHTSMSPSVSPNDSVDHEEEVPYSEECPVDTVAVPQPPDQLPTSDVPSGNSQKVEDNPVQKSPTQEIALDSMILEALGEITDCSPEYGEEIHGNLASLWLPILKKGLPKETKDNLMKEYKIPGNCKLLQAPKLNAEINAAVSDLARNRDKKMATSQQQLGIGLSAINKAMSILVQSDDKIKAIKCLSDGCRILCDLHHLDSSNRAKLLTQCLDKSFSHVVQDVERDEMLFGSSLSEKIKASKAIERQGLQIRKNAPKPASQPAAARPANSGNWSGPPRSANRGGRGYGRRYGRAANNNNQRAPPPPAAPSTSQSANKPRAAPAQRR